MWLHSLLLLLALGCSDSENPGQPRIHLNAKFLPNQSEVVLSDGSAFNLSCHGNRPVELSSTALHLRYEEKLLNPLEIKHAVPKYTGTYTCRYSNHSLEHLSTWIHLYFKKPADPASVFVTPRIIPSLKEGDDFLFMCLLTDPSVTNLTLQSEDRDGGLPMGMNVTMDPRKGALIADLRMSFRGRYTCSGWKNGQEFRSTPFDLLVVRREPVEITCQASNPSHFYSVTWTHPHIQSLKSTTSSVFVNNQLLIFSTLNVSSVRRIHSGMYTCTAINEAGVAMVTAQLRVLDQPYLQIYRLTRTTNTMKVREDLFANISSQPQEAKEELIANVSANRMNLNKAIVANISNSSIVEVYEGGDVTLTFRIEAYPPIREQRWTAPNHINNNGTTVYQQDYTVNGYRANASMLLRRVRQEDRGRYNFIFSNAFFFGSCDVDLQIFRSPSTDITEQNSTLTCSSSGYPPPTIQWFTCPGVQKSCAEGAVYQVSSGVTSQVEDKVRTHLQLSNDADDVTVECFAYNLVGNSSQVFVRRSTGLPSVLMPALIGALTFSAVLLLFLLVAIYRWRQKPKYEIRWKIIESTDGNSYTFIDPTQLPYNQKWEFPRDKLRLGAVLGSGAFGKVVEATAFGLGTDNQATRVAVKMLKPSAHSEEREALMSELKILSHLGYHDNIVNLLGACTQGGPMFMITEYCSHGDLLNFLRAHAQHFMASMWSLDKVEEKWYYKNLGVQQARLRSDSGISCCSEYQEMQPVLSPGQTAPGVLSDSLSICDLMKFSYQVAQGLDFLSTRNCIHRDVAARNVLLTDCHVAKICDFGLARDIQDDDSYIIQGNARLPVKWMSPESIFQCVYTVQSDVWSYGVLLWEIFSLGKSPYPNVAVDTNFYKMIKDGRHMDQPDFAPAQMYYLMKLCWSLEPTHRPTFKTIGKLISRLLPSTSDALPQHNEQLTYRNINEVREQEEEEEEVRGDTPKRKEEEQGHHDNRGDGDEREPMMKNIYQLS
ncbi:macrophage colony-stimulating factor 1 receptor 2 isoform X2 [Melanotaenia boesemani]|uniref:macrophage colony-stimulating factor 1 receptor 2 isoform X2 n=1 Tax=Melanotaenia boesemani TaxID=1250792 RepID=UPI001C04328E|nr:macrophage colony-stimulating factor 1 receptor 2 isoform X2 [Melanotaenia boesemani]